MTNTVWRLEDEDGYGIYNAEFGGSYFMTVAQDDYCEEYMKRHIAPDEDEALGWDELDDRRSYIFGFSSLAQFKHWVFKKKWRKGLARYDVRLNKYMVDSGYMIKGTAQAIFNPEHARLIESRRPDYADLAVRH